jgi:hypothetical protein
MVRGFHFKSTWLLLLVGLTSPALAQDISIQLTPQGIPIQIPAGGGSFDYIITATNNGSNSQQATVWCMVTLPNGNPYGPVLGPVTFMLNTGQTVSRQRTQNLPAAAPEGNYLFHAYVGFYPDSVWDSDSFGFEKLSTNPGGTQLWAARYNGPGNGSDNAYSLAVGADGSVYVTGESLTDSTNHAYTTIKYDDGGHEIWVAHYQGATPFNKAVRVALDPSGNVYVTGWSPLTGNNADYLTIKYNPSGDPLWTARYNGTGNSYDIPTALAVDANSNVFVTGTSTGSGTLLDYATVKYDSSGNELWAARYDGPDNYLDEAAAIALDDNGNCYVTGYSFDNGDEYATVKYDASGNEIWVARYAGLTGNDDYASCIALDDSGSVYVSGCSFGSSTYFDYATVKYDASGNQLWVARYDGPNHWDDKASSLVVDETGNVYVTGNTSSWGIWFAFDYATVKYDASGNQVWAVLYSSPGITDDIAASLLLDNGHNVFVTGSSNAINFNYCTIKYDSTGNQVWLAQYSGPGNGHDQAAALGQDVGGNVYVTGGSAGIGTGTDYATIKYSGGNIANWQPVEAATLGQPLPQESRLEQNFPNPFNAITTLSYKLQAASYVKLSVYDVTGRLVETLANGWREAGSHELTFDGSHLPSGVYVYCIQAGSWTASTKMVLVK